MNKEDKNDGGEKKEKTRREREKTFTAEYDG